MTMTMIMIMIDYDDDDDDNDDDNKRYFSTCFIHEVITSNKLSIAIREPHQPSLAIYSLKWRANNLIVKFCILYFTRTRGTVSNQSRATLTF